MLLLRYCHIPRINHLARSVLPDHIRPAADLHDFQSRSTFTSLMGCGSVDDSVWLQATLPIKLGGFGLSSVSTISQSAFLASWAHSLHELPARFQDMKSTVQQIASTSQPMGLLIHTLNSILTESQMLCGISVQTIRLQHKLVTEITKATASSLLENTTSPETKPDLDL